MTKRAGKKKFRMGNQPGKPVNGQPVKSPHTIVEDRLSHEESRAIELQAIREGWLINEEGYGRIRTLLLKKLATLATTAEDVETVCKIVRTISMAEQREKTIMLAHERLKSQANKELPPQVTINNSVSQAAVATLPKPFEVIQSLIANRQVRDAAAPSPTELRRPTDADPPGTVVDAG